MWKLKSNDYKESFVKTDVVSSDKKTTVLLSLKKLTLFWGLAAFSVFIPLLHFILVPTFFGLGIFAFISQYKNNFYFELAICQCPQCLQDFEIKNFYFFDGKKLSCSHCMAQLKIDKN